MRKHLKTITLTACLAFAIVGQSNAQSIGVPVRNDLALAELISSGQKQLDQLMELQGQLKAMTSNNAWITDLFPDLGTKRIADSLASIAQSGGVLSQEIQDLKDQFLVINGAEIYGSGNDGFRAQLHDALSGSALAGIAVSEHAFSQGDSAMLRLDEYRSQIGNTSDLKASVDLNTRVQVDNGVLLAQLLQLLSSAANREAHELNHSLRQTERATRLSRP